MKHFLSRILRAIKLDRTLYQEAVDEPKYFGQAIITVIAYSSFSGIGSFALAGGTGINIGMASTLIGWYVWAFTTYYIGSHFFAESKEPVERRAVYRAMGFATAPGLLRLLGLVQGVGIYIVLLVSIWIVVASVIAVKKALNYSSTWRAFGVCMIGLIASVFVQFMLIVILFQAFGVSEYAVRG
jgi:hypothetical protein